MTDPQAKLNSLRETLDFVRATLLLRHIDAATDEEVEEALRLADEELSSA